MRFKADASFLEDLERKQGKRKFRLQGLVMAATAVLISVWSLGLGNACVLAVSCAVLVFAASRLVVNSL